MSITTKLLSSSARSTSRGTQIIQKYRAYETGGALLQSATNAIELISIVNDALPGNGSGGPPIPTQGSSQDFILDSGTDITLTCVEVVPRLDACDYATFLCRFSNFRYWSGGGNPTNPDPRVVYLRTGSEVIQSVPKFVRRIYSADGGGTESATWQIQQDVDIRVNTGQLQVRVYMPFVTEDQVQTIYSRVGQIHLISGEKWRFEGAVIEEQSGGLVTGEPAFLYYTWSGENGNEEIAFESTGDIVFIPAREPFYRYTWYSFGGRPVFETYLQDELAVDVPNGWSGLPGNPILGGVPNPT